MNEPQRGFQRMVQLIEDEIWHWDPAGIVDSRAETPAEYHQIASVLARKIGRADNLDGVSRWLTEELDGNWGLGITLTDSHEFLETCEKRLRSDRSANGLLEKIRRNGADELRNDTR